MNSLLFFPDELHSPGKARITGQRYEYVKQWHDLTPGLEVRALLYNTGTGRAVITEMTDGSLEAEVHIEGDLLPRLPIHFVIAVPRPQTVKKILETTASLGIRSVHFVKTERGVKSYQQSKTLQPEAIQYHLTKGMEQACDAVSPEVTIHSESFGTFCEGTLTAIFSNGAGFYADTQGDPVATFSVLRHDPPAREFTFLIGPESGWSDSERERLQQKGIRPISLGPRMLRVETAVAVLIGEVQSQCT